MKLNKTLITHGCCKAKHIKYIKDFLLAQQAYVFHHTIEYHNYYKVSAFYSIVIYTNSENINNAFDILIKKLKTI